MIDHMAYLLYIQDLGRQGIIAEITMDIIDNIDDNEDANEENINDQLDEILIEMWDILEADIKQIYLNHANLIREREREIYQK